MAPVSPEQARQAAQDKAAHVQLICDEYTGVGTLTAEVRGHAATAMRQPLL